MFFMMVMLNILCYLCVCLMKNECAICFRSLFTFRVKYLRRFWILFCLCLKRRWCLVLLLFLLLCMKFRLVKWVLCLSSLWMFVWCVLIVRTYLRRRCSLRRFSKWSSLRCYYCFLCVLLFKWKLLFCSLRNLFLVCYVC